MGTYGLPDGYLPTRFGWNAVGRNLHLICIYRDAEKGCDLYLFSATAFQKKVRGNPGQNGSRCVDESGSTAQRILTVRIENIPEHQGVRSAVAASAILG